METLECIKTRRSIRKFKDKAVDWDKVVQILEAGRMAPSAGGVQNWKFVVIRNEKDKKKIAQACLNQEFITQADVVIVVLADPEKSETYYGKRGSRLYSIQNCAASIQNMLLAAHDIGLGSCWVGAFDEDAVRRVTMCPEHIMPQAVIPIGYPNESPKQPAKLRIEHIVYLEKYGGRRKHPMRGYYSAKFPETIERTKTALRRLKKKIKGES